jgi:hypothetical protein
VTYLRASDEDRRRVAAALERHTAAGRLSLDEFTERVGRAYLASTHGELDAIIHDLPALPTPTRPARDQRNLVIALALALLTITALGVVLALFRP